MSALVQKFFSGDYAALVREQVDSGPLSRFVPRERAYLLGALVFVGRRADAKAEFSSVLRAADADAKAIARFFLAVGASRDSDHEEARAHLTENFRSRRNLKTEEALFYVFQGWGFFRYFDARFGRAALWSERAWRVAYGARFTYGMTLSADLRGHSLLQVGQVARGLRSLEQAAELASTGAVKATLETSLLSYRAQFGLLSDASKKLLKSYRALATSDTYSRSNLLLERARALVIEGRAEEALVWLEEGAGEIFRHGHRRQKAGWLARRALALLAQGRNAEAAQAIGQGLGELEEKSDQNHRLELLELRMECAPEEPSLSEEIPRLRRWIGRRAAPESPLEQWRAQRRKDPRDPSLVATAVARGWQGLLRELVAPEAETLFYLELLPGRLVVLARGNVEVSDEPVPEILKRLLMELSFTLTTKQALVEKVWGYRYDPLRHDPLLYNSVYRLRKLLGASEALLVAENEGYRWAEPAKVRVFEREYSAPADTGASIQAGLSFRQHRALQHLKSSGALGVHEYAEKFRVSKPTATRDLAELLRKGYLARVGKARATVYVLSGPADKKENL